MELIFEAGMRRKEICICVTWDDDLIARLKRRATRHGRSTGTEHAEILRQALANEEESSFDKLAAHLRKLTKRRKQTPSEVLLREGREER